MADYFPLLSRTIASLGNSTAEQRQVVYQRARVVVETQLSAIDPPMDPDAIAVLKVLAMRRRQTMAQLLGEVADLLWEVDEERRQNHNDEVLRRVRVVEAEKPADKAAKLAEIYQYEF